MDDFLCFGDFVSLYTDDQGGYVYSNHSSSAFNEVAVSTGGLRNKPLDDNVLTFEVCPPTRYQFSSHYRDRPTDPIKIGPNKSGPNDSDSNNGNQAVYEAEQAFNAAEIQRQRGRPVCYGQTIQFRHKFTNKFVQVSSITTSYIEKQNGSVSLQFGDSINGQFKILPKHKYRREGDRVRLEERLVFESIACPLNYLHVSEEQFNQDKLVYNKHFELNMSALQSTFFVLRNSTHIVDGDNQLKNGTVVRFFHNELQGYLVAEGYFGREILENVHLRLRPLNRERPHSLQPSSSAITYWQVEVVTNNTTDGYIKQSSTIRLLHLCTRQYLCLDTLGKGAEVTLTSDPKDVRTQFKLVSVDEGASNITYKSMYCLESVSTGHWIHASDDTYKKMQKNSMRDSRPLESLPISKAQLRVVRASSSSSRGDSFNEKQFEDLFVLEKVSDMDYKQYTFVAGMVPYLFKRHIATIQDQVVSRNIVKCFNEMIAFMAENGKPVKTRQKLFRNLGVVDRMLELLRETFQPQNTHMCTAFTLVYDLLRAYVRGTSRKNKIHVARHMSLYFSHFSYHEGQVHQHAADMVNEFIRDNMEVLERITNDDMTKLVDFIRRDKEYRFLELMDNFCVCQNKAVKDNQKYITNSWLKSETRNCLFFTKMGREVGKDPQDAVFVTVDNARNWLNLCTELTQDPKRKADSQFFYHQLKTYERLCFGRNSYAITTLTSDLKYVTTEQARVCLRNTELPEEFRALYCQLIIALYVNTQEIQRKVHPIEELYLYKYNPSDENVVEEGRSDEESEEYVNMKDLKYLKLTKFVQTYITMGSIQISVKEGTNRLTAQVLSLLKHLILLGKHQFDVGTIGDLVHLLNGMTDKPKSAFEEDVQKYRGEERFEKSDMTAAIVETKIQCLLVLETYFDHILRNRLKELLTIFRTISTYSVAEVMDPSIQSEDTPRFFGTAKNILQSVFTKTAMFSHVDLPTIMVDLTKYQYESLVTKSMETFDTYFSAIQTLLTHAGRVQILTMPTSATRCEEVKKDMIFIKDRLESKLSDSDASRIIELLEKFARFCEHKTGAPRTTLQNFLFSQGILECIFTMLTSKEMQDLDVNSLQTCALHLLEHLARNNEQIQNSVIFKIDLLLTMDKYLDSVFRVIKAVFAGNVHTCKQVTDHQICVIVKHLTEDGNRHTAILFDILQTVVKPDRLGKPLRRNQNLVMRHMTQIRSRISYQFGLDEHSFMSFISDKDVTRVTYFLATVDLMATCAQNGSMENKASLRSALDVRLLLKVLTKSSLSHTRIRPCLRAFTYAYCEGCFDEENGGTDSMWPTSERTMLDALLKSAERDLRKVCDNDLQIGDTFLVKMQSKSTCDYSETDTSSHDLLEYQLDTVVPFCQCFCTCVPIEKVADNIQTDIRSLCEKFKEFLEKLQPHMDKLSPSLREELIGCMKSIKAFVQWKVNIDDLERKYMDTGNTKPADNDVDKEQEVNKQFQTFIRNLRLVSEGLPPPTEEAWTVIRKRKMEFKSLEQKNEFRPLYEYFVEDEDKPGKNAFEMTEKIIIELKHARSVKVHNEVVFPKPGLHQRYMQALRAVLLKEIVKLSTDFEVHLHSNRRELERLRTAQTTLVEYGAVESALQDLAPHLGDPHLKESLHLLIALLFHGNLQTQDAISTFFLERPDVLVIATLQSRIARFRDYAMETEPIRKFATTKEDDEEKKETREGRVPLQANHVSNGGIHTDGPSFQDSRDDIPLTELTSSNGEAGRSPAWTNRVYPLHEVIKKDQQDKPDSTNTGSYGEVERETVEVTNLVLEFIGSVCQNQHTQLQNYFREQYPIELSTNFVNILVDLIDTVYNRINSNIVTVVIQAFDCLAQIVSGNKENKAVVLHSRVCEQTNFMLYMSMYRDCSTKQVYTLKKSVGTFWRAMTEETCVVLTTGGDSSADLASTAIEYLDSEVAIQVMKQASQDQTNKEGKKIQGLVKSVGFQYCQLLERKLFKFPSLKQQDILKTEEDRKIFESYSESTRCVELLKDDTLHKVFFRVKNKNVFSGADIRERIKYDMDRSSTVEKIKDLMKWSNETTRYARNRWNKCKTPVGKLLINSWYPFNCLMLVLTMAILIMIGVDYDGGENASKRYKVQRSSKVKVAVFVLGGVHNVLSLIIFIHFVILHQPQFHGLLHIFKVTRLAIQKKSIDVRLREFETIDSRLQISAYGPKMIYYVLFLAASICGTALHGFTFALCLIQIVELNRHLKRMVRAVSYNGRYLYMLVLLGMIILYIYGMIAFLFLREAYIKQEDGHYCNSMPQCFVTILHHGLVGTTYKMFDESPPSSFTTAILIGLFNLSFFIIITILGLYIVLAIIVDGFLNLKQKMRQAKSDFRAMCFICGRPNADFSSAAKGYEDHVTREHNIWDYIYFFIHLDTTGTSEYSALENYVHRQLSEGKYDFLPINRALCLEEADKVKRVLSLAVRTGDSGLDKGLVGSKKKMKRLPSFKSEPSKSKEKKAGKSQLDDTRGRGYDGRPIPETRRSEVQPKEPERRDNTRGRGYDSRPTPETRRSEVQPKEPERSDDTKGKGYDSRPTPEARQFDAQPTEAVKGTMEQGKSQQDDVGAYESKQIEESKEFDEQPDKAESDKKAKKRKKTGTASGEKKGARKTHKEPESPTQTNADREVKEHEEELQAFGENETDIPEQTEPAVGEVGKDGMQALSDVEDLSHSLTGMPTNDTSG